MKVAEGSTDTSITQSKVDINTLYDTYAPALYGEIKRRLYKDDISQKVMADAFIKLCNKLNQPSHEKIFITAYKVVREEISKTKVNIALNTILYSQMKKQQQITL